MSDWIAEPGDDGMIHVKPRMDLRVHGGTDCWCRPTPEDDRPDIIVHHSMDLREEYECGRLPS